MTKRIAYIISDGPTEGRSVPEHALEPGFAVGIVASRATPFPGDAVDLLVTEVSTVEAAMRAEAEGYDAVLIGAVADYGIDAVRAAVRIPAVGSGQASMLAAAALGRRFSIVTIWPVSTASHYRAILGAAELGGRCASVRHVSTDAEMATLADEDSFYTRMRAGREEMLARITTEMQAAVRDDGADVIVLGCNCMTPVAGLLADRVDVPVIDPTAAGYRFTTMLLSLGLAHSPVAFPPAIAERRSVLAEMVDAARTALDRKGGPPECEVCVLTDDGSASCAVPQPAAAS